MNAFRSIGIAALAGAAMLALTAGGAAALSKPHQLDATTNVLAMHVAAISATGRGSEIHGIITKARFTASSCRVCRGQVRPGVDGNPKFAR